MKALFDVAVQVHVLLATETSIVPVPPAAGICADCTPSPMVKIQGAPPACVTGNVVVPMVIEPLRDAALRFAKIVRFTVPGPVALPAPCIWIQLTVSVTVQVQAASVCT